MSSISLSLPDELAEQVAARAEASGLSVNQYVATLLAAQVRAQSETERQFATRAARATPGRARAILAMAGQGNPPAPGDESDAER